MKKMFLVFIGMTFVFLFMGACSIGAQALSSDRQEVKKELSESKENAQIAKTEEEQLKEQIKTAVISGDFETAKQLRRRLSLVHQKNVQENIADKQGIQANIQELKSDLKENNPPGPAGGPGASPNQKGEINS